jgi:hypothetical protein
MVVFAIMIAMVCLIVWIATAMAMEFPIARTAARMTLAVTERCVGGGSRRRHFAVRIFME